jgi:hypothetical protein
MTPFAGCISIPTDPNVTPVMGASTVAAPVRGSIV